MNTIEQQGLVLRVNCWTYNQRAYITDAMNGFVMQKTDFPFVCAIVDDASTDGEQEVIRDYVIENFDLKNSFVAYEKDTDYGHVSFARHKTNKNCYFAVIYLKENHYSQKKSKLPYLKEWMDIKYVAICEGDDYWTDPLKLQKQVDFMEQHPEYSLCCHRYAIYNQNDGTWEDDYVKKLFEKHPEGFSFGNKENLNTWITKTLTLMYRCDCYNDSELAKYKYRCDEHVNYHLLKKGRGYCFPFVGGVYRRCNSGVFSVLSEENKFVRWCQIRSEMLNLNLDDEDLRNNVYFRARKYLYNHKICKDLYRTVAVCLKSYYYSDGLWATMRAMKKIAGSYWHGFKAIRSKG